MCVFNVCLVTLTRSLQTFNTIRANSRCHRPGAHAIDAFVLYREKTAKHAPLFLTIAYWPLQGGKLQ